MAQGPSWSIFSCRRSPRRSTWTTYRIWAKTVCRSWCLSRTWIPIERSASSLTRRISSGECLKGSRSLIILVRISLTINRMLTWLMLCLSRRNLCQRNGLAINLAIGRQRSSTDKLKEEEQPQSMLHIFSHVWVVTFWQRRIKRIIVSKLLRKMIIQNIKQKGTVSF